MSKLEQGEALGQEYLLPFEGSQDSLDPEEELAGMLDSDGEFSEPKKSKAPKKQASESEADDRDADRDTDEEAESEDGEEAEDQESDEDSEESADEEEEDAEEEEPQFFTVKVAGEEQKVTLEELRAGYSRTQDYTRKTQALAQKEREGLGKLTEVQGRYGERLKALEEVLSGAVNKEPDWDALRAQDPTRYAVEFAEHQRRKEALEKVRKEQAQVEKEREAADTALRMDYVREEYSKLQLAVPDFNAEMAEGISKYAVENCAFSPDEVSNVMDHRLVLLLRKAMLYDQGEKGKETVRKKVREKVKEVTPTMKPGNRERPDKSKKALHSKRIAQSARRLARTGHVDDAAVLLAQMMGDDD